ncbi:MAG: LptE family protein [Chitinophagales bacterium]|nr:LptE family protein [Bacteroidota bacterium]
MTFRSKIYLLCCLWISVLFSGCGIYSFTGTSIPEGAETVSVDYFINRAGIVNPLVSQVFLETMQNKMQRETRLKLADDNRGDLVFSGEINRYDVSPTASGQNDQAALNRLTMGVKCTFTNQISGEEWTKSYTSFEDFNASTDLTSVENELITELCRKLVDNIFNDALSNW